MAMASECGPMCPVGCGMNQSQGQGHRYAKPPTNKAATIIFQILWGFSCVSCYETVCLHCASQELRYDWKQNYQEPGVEAELNFEFFEFTIISSKVLNNDMGAEALRLRP